MGAKRPWANGKRRETTHVRTGKKARNDPESINDSPWRERTYIRRHSLSHPLYQHVDIPTQESLLVGSWSTTCHPKKIPNPSLPRQWDTLPCYQSRSTPAAEQHSKTNSGHTPHFPLCHLFATTTPSRLTLPTRKHPFFTAYRKLFSPTFLAFYGKVTTFTSRVLQYLTF